jgi:hypothetical protein
MLCRAAFTCQNSMKLLLTNYTLGPVAEKVVGWSISHHLQNTLEPVLRNGKLIISAERLVRLLLVFSYDRWMYICRSLLVDGVVCVET